MHSMAVSAEDILPRPSLGQEIVRVPSVSHQTPADRNVPDFDVISGTVVRRHAGIWSNAIGVVADIYCEQGLKISFKVPRTSIVMALEEVGGHLDIRPLDIREVTRHSNGQAEATISVLPRGCRSESFSGAMTFIRLFVLELDSENPFSDPGAAPVRFRPLIGSNDTRISKICMLLAQECRGPDSNGLTYADTLVFALEIALARLDDAEARIDPKGGLAPWQLRRVQNYMMENITQTISAKDLAELAQLSMTHFGRAFKTSVGCAPHQWMTAKRIERAKRYLISGEVPIVEISLALGFCDQAHFTRVFRKAVGDTPLNWQRTRRR